jgi:hypothetical protein
MQARKGIPRIHCFFITLSEYLDGLRRRRLAVAAVAIAAPYADCSQLAAFLIGSNEESLDKDIASHYQDGSLVTAS